MSEKSIPERVDEITTVSPRVNDVSLAVWKRFKSYANEFSKGNYSIALDQLLRVADISAKEEAMWCKLNELEDRLVAVENKPAEVGRPKIATFGKKKDEGDVK